MLSIIKYDLLAWCKWKKLSPSYTSYIRFVKYKEFRVQIAYRLSHSNLLIGRCLAFIVRMFTSSLNLNIWCNDIGAGLRIMHGWNTVINCKKIGRNFFVGQNVTIGWSKSGTPIIGDNVTVWASAIIVENVRIGDGACICAGSVVTRDVESNTMVAGNPAKVIKKRYSFNGEWENI